MSTRSRHAALVFLCAVVTLLTGTRAVPVAATPARLATSRAVVIVDAGGSVHRQVISFAGTVSGMQALRSTPGANPVTVNYGGSLGEAVCKLYGVGDEPVPGQCPNGWAYYRAPAGAGGWSYSGAGPSNTTVHDGDVEGWKYGGGSPPFSSFCAVAGCALPAPPPPPPAPPAAAGGQGSTGSGSASPGGGPAPGTPGGPAATTAPGGESATTGDGSTTSSSDGRTGKGSGGKGNHHGKRAVSTRPADSHDDSGSPASFIVFGVVLVLLIAGVMAVRRVRHRPKPDPAA